MFVEKTKVENLVRLSLKGSPGRPNLELMQTIQNCYSKTGMILACLQLSWPSVEAAMCSEVIYPVNCHRAHPVPITWPCSLLVL
jgi:hypothetical protein